VRRFWYRLAVFLTAALAIGCGKLGQLRATSSWSPPTNPNPHEIYREAQGAIKSGDFTNALLMLVWFHENALKHDEALAGVRLSYALNDWLDLGTAHPPALDQLKTVRDKAGQEVREATDSVDCYQAFMDFESINKKLNEDAKTKDLFLWLDANKPNRAKDVFSLAEPALIRSMEYVICGKYADPETQFASALDSFRTTSEIANSRKHGERLQDYADKKLKNAITTLIAVLVLNDRKAEAGAIAEKLSNESDLPDFKPEIAKALNGEMPAPWP
jgi:hypothetical protein